MRDTYYVGFDPKLKSWDAMPIQPHYHPDTWVFKVFARNEHDALSQGMKQFKGLVSELDDQEMDLLRHIHRNALKFNSKTGSMFMVDVPIKLLVESAELQKKGFFTPGHETQVLIDLSSAGWKALEMHLAAEERAPAKHHEYGMAMA